MQYQQPVQLPLAGAVKQRIALNGSKTTSHGLSCVYIIDGIADAAAAAGSKEAHHKRNEDHLRHAMGDVTWSLDTRA